MSEQTANRQAEPEQQCQDAQPCEHHFASEHIPGHLVYWIRQCMLCHEVDWDDLDREIRSAVAGRMA